MPQFIFVGIAHWLHNFILSGIAY